MGGANHATVYHALSSYMCESHHVTPWCALHTYLSQNCYIVCVREGVLEPPNLCTPDISTGFGVFYPLQSVLLPLLLLECAFIGYYNVSDICMLEVWPMK